MSTQPLYKYRIYCTTEQDWQYLIKDTDTPLTVCPNNHTHTVNENSSNLVETIQPSSVELILEAGPKKTGGFYSLHGRAFTAKGATGGQPVVTTNAYIMDIPITVLSGWFTSRPELEGDVASVHVLPQNPTIVGVITANVNDADTTIHVDATTRAMIEIDKVARLVLVDSTNRKSNKLEVDSIDNGAGTITFKTEVNTEDGNPLLASSPTYVHLDTNIIGYITATYTTNQLWINVNPTVIQHMYIGRWINLFQSNASKTDLRMVVELDANNNKIKINSPFDVVLNPGVSTVYVQMTISMAYNCELEPNETIDAGKSTIGGSYLENVVVLFKYERHSEGDVRIRYKYEILY